MSEGRRGGRAELWEGPEVTDDQAEIPLASSLVNSTQQMDYVCTRYMK